MFRHAAIVAIVLCLAPSWLSAQTTEFTVSTPSAAVRKMPSTGSPVIGEAPRGTVLEVTRDLGSWIKVAWPAAPDGIGYVHLSMGKVGPRGTGGARMLTTAAPAPAAAPGAVPATSVASVPSSDPGAVPMTTRTTYVAPPTHFMGFGGRFSGSPERGFGITSRIWSRQRLGVQLDVSRSRLNNASTPEHLSTIQFAPSAVYSLRDHVSDYIWLRPYFGGGGTLNRSTLKSGTPDAASTSKSHFGLRVFGGSEFTFPSVPRFAISADLGYLWSETPFEGYKLGGFGVTAAGHWYVK
jgi:hypothetical protein